MQIKPKPRKYTKYYTKYISALILFYTVIFLCLFMFIRLHEANHKLISQRYGCDNYTMTFFSFTCLHYNPNYVVEPGTELQLLNDINMTTYLIWFPLISMFFIMVIGFKVIELATKK